MNADPNLTAITPLNTVRWEAAQKQARDMIRSRYPEPQRRQFEARVYSKYPNWLTAVMGLGLAILGVSAFIISAGKMIVSADMTLAPVVRDSMRLSAGWLDTVIILSLIFGEVGTALFSLAAAIFSSGKVRVWRFEFSPAPIIFRTSALICAALAIAGNVGVSATHWADFQSVALFGWGLTILPPAIVIVVSLLGEKMVLAALETRAAADNRYQAAIAEWETIVSKPEDHPDYKAALYMAILDRLMSISTANRKKIETAVEANPMIRKDLVERELGRHSWTQFVIDSPNFTQPPAMAGDHPALSAG